MGISDLKKHSWQAELAGQITDPAELWQMLELDEALLPAAVSASNLFPLKATRSYVARIKKGDANDPLLRQIMPLGIETLPQEGFSKDPLGEKAANPITGLLHKYQSRVLVTLTSACAIHCRYCFRRHFSYDTNNPGRSGWQAIYDYINQDDQINEMILSGGDPLSVSDDMLRAFTDGLQQVKHIKTLRLHTRVPVVLPSRITEDFLDWLKSLSYKVVIVIHVNHSQELTEEVRSVLQRLRDRGAILLNQSVLLKGVNDSVAALTDLSEALFAVGVLPYYLHLLDKVEGAAHFDVPMATAKHLHLALTKQLSGYLVPRLVCEQAGEPSKTMIF